MAPCAPSYASDDQMLVLRTWTKTTTINVLECGKKCGCASSHFSGKLVLFGDFPDKKPRIRGVSCKINTVSFPDIGGSRDGETRLCIPPPPPILGGGGGRRSMVSMVLDLPKATIYNRHIPMRVVASRCEQRSKDLSKT